MRLATSIAAVLLAATLDAAGPKRDRFGDPLPPGAVHRLGTLRFRHFGESWSVAYSADGRFLAAATHDASVIVWEAATGKRVRLIRFTDTGGNFQDHVAGIAMSPDNKTLAAALMGGTVRLVEFRTGKRLKTIPIPRNMLTESTELLFSSDGKHLFVANGGRAVSLLDVGGGKARRIPISPGFAFHIAIAPDGRTLATPGERGSVQLWDAKTGKRKQVLKTGFKSVGGLAFHPEGDELAVWSGRQIKVIDTGSGKVTRTLNGESPKDLFMSVRFTPDENLLLGGSQEGDIYVWDAATGKRRHRLKGKLWLLRNIAVSPDSRRVAGAFVYNVIRQWDLKTGKQLHPKTQGHESAVHAVAYSPDGTRILTGGANRQTWLWDAKTGRRIAAVTPPTSGFSVAWQPDGKRFFTTWQYNRAVRVFNAATGKRVARWNAAAAVRRMALSRDGRQIVTLEQNFGSRDTFLEVIDAVTGKRLRKIDQPVKSISSLALSPDGRLAAVGGGDLIRLFDLKSGAESALLNWHSHNPRGLQFTPDGLFLVSGSFDRNVIVWELVNGTPWHVSREHSRAITALAISPDGRTIATASGTTSYPYNISTPHKIRFWDLWTGQQIGTLSGHDSYTMSLAFAPDGKSIVSGHIDSTAIVWEVPKLKRPVTAGSTEVDADELKQAWKSLSREDPRLFRPAMNAFLKNGKATVDFLSKRVLVAKTPSKKLLERLLKGLESADAGVQRRAVRTLRDFGRMIETDLELTAKANSPKAARDHCKRLLEDIRRPIIAQKSISEETVRRLRAVLILKAIGSPEARSLLRKLSRGAASSELTRYAALALQK